MEICKQARIGRCERGPEKCKYAHPSEHHEIIGMRVTICRESLSAKCKRERCRFWHPPAHLMAAASALSDKFSTRQVAGALQSPGEMMVCRQALGGRCERGENACRYAHLKGHEVVTDNRVTICHSSLSNKCSRETCKYLHPPPHLLESSKALVDAMKSTHLMPLKNTQLVQQSFRETGYLNPVRETGYLNPVRETGYLNPVQVVQSVQPIMQPVLQQDIQASLSGEDILAELQEINLQQQELQARQTSLMALFLQQAQQHQQAQQQAQQLKRTHTLSMTPRYGEVDHGRELGVDVNTWTEAGASGRIDQTRRPAHFNIAARKAQPVTEPCRDFLKGCCTRGRMCRFRHDRADSSLGTSFSRSPYKRLRSTQ